MPIKMTLIIVLLILKVNARILDIIKESVVIRHFHVFVLILNAFKDFRFVYNKSILSIKSHVILILKMLWDH